MKKPKKTIGMVSRAVKPRDITPLTTLASGGACAYSSEDFEVCEVFADIPAYLTPSMPSNQARPMFSVLVERDQDQDCSIEESWRKCQSEMERADEAEAQSSL